MLPPSLPPLRRAVRRTLAFRPSPRRVTVPTATGSTRVATLALLAGLAAAPLAAQLTPAAGWVASPVYVVADGETPALPPGEAPGRLASFDYGSDGHLYYSTSDASFANASFWRWDGAAATRLYHAPGNFGGASVVAVGDRIYFNDSDFTATYIRSHVVGSAGTAVVSTANNYGLHRGATAGPARLWMTAAAAPTYATEIFQAATDAAGDLASGFVRVAVPGGASGPMAFDAAGNLFYAVGFFATEFHAWSAAQVAAALADPVGAVLTPANAVLTRDFGADFPGAGGATGMAFDADGALLLSLTRFTDPSVVARYSLSGLAVTGSTAIATATGRLGDIRLVEGVLHVAAGDGIYALGVPEPQAASLALGVLAALAAIVARRGRG